MGSASHIRFRISPNSFFQVNTSGAEALYGVGVKPSFFCTSPSLLFPLPHILAGCG